MLAVSLCAQDVEPTTMSHIPTSRPEAEYRTAAIASQSYVSLNVTVPHKQIRDSSREPSEPLEHFTTAGTIIAVPMACLLSNKVATCDSDDQRMQVCAYMCVCIHIYIYNAYDSLTRLSQPGTLSVYIYIYICICTFPPLLSLMMLMIDLL